MQEGWETLGLDDNLGTTAKQIAIVWACAAKRRQRLGEEIYGVWSGGCRPKGRPKKTWREIVEKDCQAHKLNRKDAMYRNRLRKQVSVFVLWMCDMLCCAVLQMCVYYGKDGPITTSHISLWHIDATTEDEIKWFSQTCLENSSDFCWPTVYFDAEPCCMSSSFYWPTLYECTCDYSGAGHTSAVKFIDVPA